jgi:peptide/nickel transport system permease protein
MLRLLLARTLMMLLTAFAVSALLFFSVVGLLGSPAAMMLGQDASPRAIAALNAQYGFNQPIVTQYLHWLGDALHGDLGRSYTTQQSVAHAILTRIPITLELTFWAILLAAVGAVVINTIPTGRRMIVSATTAVNLIGITVPNFMLGVSLVFLLSVELDWLPSTGWVPWSAGICVHLRHMLMPVMTLSLY